MNPAYIYPGLQARQISADCAAGRLNNIFLTLMIACAPQMIWASSPACSSSSSTSGVSKQQALTKKLKYALLALDFKNAIQLVKEGADINITIDENGTTPLMFAAQKEFGVIDEINDPFMGQRNDVDISDIRLFAIGFFARAVRAGADLDAKDSYGRTVRDYAQEECKSCLRQVDMVHAVAQRAHDPVSLTNYLQNADWNEWDPSFNVMQKNVACKHPINYTVDRYGNNILLLAAQWGRAEDLRLLLNAPNVDIEARDTYNETALRVSTRNPHFSDCAQMIIDSGAKINAKNSFGNSALFNACRLRNLSVIDVLYANGAQSKDIVLLPNSGILNNDQRDTISAMMYYTKAEKPIRQKYGTDTLFQEALQAWNVRMEQFKDCYDTLNANQIKRCDAVIAKRSQLLSGGNILQLLKERETNPLHSSLLKRRLLQRVNALPERDTK